MKRFRRNYPNCESPSTSFTFTQATLSFRSPSGISPFQHWLKSMHSRALSVIFQPLKGTRQIPNHLSCQNLWLQSWHIRGVKNPVFINFLSCFDVWSIVPQGQAADLYILTAEPDVVVHADPNDSPDGWFLWALTSWQTMKQTAQWQSFSHSLQEE